MHGHVYGTYTVGYGPRTRPCFATYRLRTRPCSGHGRPVCTAVYVPCTGPCMVRPLPEHGRVHGRVPCTRPCLGPVYAAVYRVHARVCGLCIRQSTAVYRLRTGHVHGPFMTRTRRRPPHGRVYSPCRVHGRSRRVRTVRTVYTTTRCIPGIAKVDNRNLLDGYYANPIIRSLENDLFTFAVAVTF